MAVFLVPVTNENKKMNSTEAKTRNLKDPDNPIQLIVTVVLITAVCSVTICTICGWVGLKVIISCC